MRNCRICKKDLPLTEFSKNKSKKDGHGHACRPCVAKYNRERYKERKDVREYHKKNRSEIRLRNKELIYTYLKSNPCVDCGESDPVVLEFDHVRGIKEFNLSECPSGGYSVEKVEEEIKKCDIRCANCHRRKTAKQFGWTK